MTHESASSPRRFLPRLLALLAVALSSGVSLPACTRKQSAPPQSAATSTIEPDTPVTPVTIDKPVFHFDYKRAISLTIAKADPASGDHWMARVERQRESTQSTKSFHDDDAWKVESYSENGSLPDRLANRTLILHLLDTLSTLHPIESVTADGGDGALRANYGLNPPRYALRWEVLDEGGGNGGQLRVFQVEIGGLVNEGRDSERVAYGMFPPNPAIYKLDGAALPMLEYIKTFSVLRQQVLSPLTSDDVDEIEIRHGGRKAFYAQRDGDVWADQKHRPWKKDVQGFLDRITHLRIENFIDGKSDAASLRVALERHALAEIILTNRFSKSTVIRLAREGSRALADISTRPGAVFELYPGALSRLSP